MRNRGRSPISARVAEMQFSQSKSGSVPDFSL
jgi:hypothetical protein